MGSWTFPYTPTFPFYVHLNFAHKNDYAQFQAERLSSIRVGSQAGRKMAVGEMGVWPSVYLWALAQVDC